MNRKLPALAASVFGMAMLFTARADGQSQPSAPTPVSSVTTVAPAAPVLPSTKDLLDKFQTASGGRNVWAGFTTRYMKGIYQSEDASAFAGIEIFSKAPDKVLSKITFSNGVVVREVCDGKSAWIEDPAGGMHMITGPALRSRIRQANFQDRADALLMAVSGRVLGTEKVGAHSTYVLEFSPEKEIVSKIYFDATTGFAVRADDTLHRDDGDYQVQSYMDDYRPVDGAYFPFRIRHIEKGNIFTIRITQIKNNVPVEDSLFLKPVSVIK